MAVDVTLTRSQSSNFCLFTLNSLNWRKRKWVILSSTKLMCIKPHVHFRYLSYLICDVDGCIQKSVPHGEISRLGRWVAQVRLSTFWRGNTLPCFVHSWVLYVEFHRSIKDESPLSGFRKCYLYISLTFRVFVISRYNETPVILDHNKFWHRVKNLANL